MAWLLVVVAAVVAVGINLLLAPKAKAQKPSETTDMDNPTAEAGRPIPVVFGTITVKGLNVLWYGDKYTKTKKVSSGGGKK
jgi:predicted phage tail protein